MRIEDMAFDDYFELIKKRNKETTKDGHDPFFGVFQIEEDLLEKNKDLFRQFHKIGISAYKALTFFEPE